MALFPLVASSRAVLSANAYAAAMKLSAVAAWRAVSEVLGASSFFLFSVVCCTAAALTLALAALRIVAGRDGLERPYMLLRAFVLLHGAVGPFLALSATQHLSPTVRGRPVLARYLAVVLEHQAFLSFATAALATAWVVTALGATPKPHREVLPRIQVARSLIAAYVACGVASRVLAQTFAAAAADAAAVAPTLELELALAIAGIGVAVLAAMLLAARASPVAVPAEDESPPPKRLAALPRTLATILLPLFALSVVSWASSRPCDPDPEELAHVPTVPSVVTRPLPLARGEAEASADEGVLVADATKRLRDVWPRGVGAREVRLVVQRDAFERGRTGMFARFGDGRFGVLRMTFADRDAPPPTCATVAFKRCVDASGGAVTASLVSSKAGEGTPSFVYRPGSEETVAELAQDVSTLLKATYAVAQATPLDLDVDLLVAYTPKAPEPGSKAPRPLPVPHPPAPPAADTGSPLPSPGCTSARAAARFEPHEVPSDGASRRVFVSAAAASEGPRSLILVLHGDDSSAEEMRSSLPLEPRLGATSVLVYPEARAHRWDADAPLASNPDAAFLRAAVTFVEANFCVDQRRRFVAGFSSGGYLANALACEGDFRAVAAYSARGPAPVDDVPDAPSGLYRCKPAAALVIHGVDDAVIPVGEGTSSAEMWRVTNRCAPATSAASCEVYGGCDRPVERCLVPGLGHALARDAAERTAAFFESLR